MVRFLRSRSRPVLVLLFVALLTVGFVGVLAIEAWLASRRAYLDADPGYRVDFTAQPRDAAGAQDDTPVKLVMLGDSTVAGLGAETERESLPGQVAQQVADLIGRPVQVRGLGRSGADTRSLISEQVPKLRELENADVVAIEIGSNDVLDVTPPWTMQRRTEKMLRQVRSAAPDAIVVLGSAGQLNSPNFLQPLRAVIVRMATATRHAQQRAAAAEQVAFFDVAREVSPEYSTTPGTSSKDRFHPSPLGYSIWARPFAERIASALGSEQPRP